MPVRGDGDNEVSLLTRVEDDLYDAVRPMLWRYDFLMLSSERKTCPDINMVLNANRIGNIREVL